MSNSGTNPSARQEVVSRASPPPRLISLDAYRGFIMLAMASGAFGFKELAGKPEVLVAFSGTVFDGAWQGLWRLLAYEFEHVPWTGCGFWDLIQPSFMFMVGVAMPYSYARRSQLGQSRGAQFCHVVLRSLILVLLGLFLSSNGQGQTHFTFVNVLTQIGLGYTVLYLFCENPNFGWSNRTWLLLQFLGVSVILIGYWAWFNAYSIPADAQERIVRFVSEDYEKRNRSPQALAEELALVDRFSDGYAKHWNKHTNAAASVDRWLLNAFPRSSDVWEGKRFWVNSGGYQTLNFIPSLATMLFGLMAGHVLRSSRTPAEIVRWLLLAGTICFGVSLAVDTTIWPIALFDWTLCPAVKRIWSPTWAVFSSGWTFWMLAAFYWTIDVRGWRRWAWPFAMVGMNSIAIYCLSQLMSQWTLGALKTHFTTLDAWFGLEHGLRYLLTEATYAPFISRTAVLFVFWIICWWLYRSKIFVRI